MSVRFEARLTERGYRAVMLRVALVRLRWLLPLAAFFGFGAMGRGETGTTLVIAGMTVATIVGLLGYAAWATGSPAHQRLYRPVSYVADESGLAFSSPDGDGTVEWDQVRRWQYASGHYLLYVGSASYVLVPRGDVGPDEAVEEFESLLRTHVARGPRARW